MKVKSITVILVLITVNCKLRTFYYLLSQLPITNYEQRTTNELSAKCAKKAHPVILHVVFVSVQPQLSLQTGAPRNHEAFCTSVDHEPLMSHLRPGPL